MGWTKEKAKEHREKLKIYKEQQAKEKTERESRGIFECVQCSTIFDSNIPEETYSKQAKLCSFNCYFMQQTEELQLFGGWSCRKSKVSRILHHKLDIDLEPKQAALLIKFDNQNGRKPFNLHEHEKYYCKIDKYCIRPNHLERIDPVFVLLKYQLPENQKDQFIRYFIAYLNNKIYEKIHNGNNNFDEELKYLKIIDEIKEKLI